jgi:hypothetical protein
MAGKVDLMPRALLLTAGLVLAACGGAPADRPAAAVRITRDDAARWAPGPPRQAKVPVLVYHGIRPGARGEDVTPAQFARQMALLQHAGYRTIELPTFARFLRGEPVALPARPFVLTIDDGRRDSWTGSDAVLRAAGYRATLFVDVGRVDRGAAGYLRWRELDGLQRSGRWDVQLQAGTGKLLIRYGSAPQDVGPFYAYRGEDEVVAGWRERVFGDISWAERLLAVRVHGYRPLAFSPPYGNYGQAGTNDPEIPRLLLARLHGSFPLVFTQDRPALARRGHGTAAPIGRLAMTAAHGERDLFALLHR